MLRNIRERRTNYAISMCKIKENMVKRFGADTVRHILYGYNLTCKDIWNLIKGMNAEARYK